MAAILQDYGFATLLGEETSDLATIHGAMETFALPRTGLVVGHPKALILRPNANPAPTGVVPDIIIDTPVLESPEDPVLQQALQIIRDGTKACSSRPPPTGIPTSDLNLWGRTAPAADVRPLPITGPSSIAMSQGLDDDLERQEVLAATGVVEPG